MIDTSTKQAYLKLHISIIISCFTGIFGRVITLNEGILVWERLIISFAVFLLIMIFVKKFKPLPIKETFKVTAIGFLLGLNWLFFYASIKYSNVSIGILCLSAIGLFTAILDPIINRHRFSKREIAFSLITISGLALIFHFDSQYQAGIIMGLLASFFGALYTISNKGIAEKIRSSSNLLLYELFGGALIMSIILPFYLHFFPVKSLIPGMHDLFYLLILSIICTIGLYLLRLQSLKKISAFTVNNTCNLEPVYTIFLAIVILGEAKELNTMFYAGLALIVASVVLQTLSALKPVPVTTDCRQSMIASTE